MRIRADAVCALDCASVAWPAVSWGHKKYVGVI
jgi:hypothetical protein